MDNFLTVLIILIIFGGLAFALLMRRVTIFEHERGLLYRQGKFVRILAPGSHGFFGPLHSASKVDVRLRYVTITGQEVLTSDNIGIRISLAASYQIEDPYKAVHQSAHCHEALYLILQLALRDLVGALAVDDLLAKRQEISQALLEQTAGKAAELGLKLELVSIKDIMFPGELKNIFAQVVNARKEGLAALERARGESAALRNLANAAQLFEGHPHLWQMRALQALEAPATPWWCCRKGWRGSRRRPAPPGIETPGWGRKAR
jgi:regulator of protease activity HflC (stomatin/prohibitin superfamily)